MKIKLITIGKIKRGPHQEIASDYIGRIGRYVPFEHIAVKSEGDVLKKILQGDYFVLLDGRGCEMDSKGFANFIGERQVRSTRYIVFAIGPSDGFGEEIRAKANTIVSVSRLTLQHDLAVLVLLEQIYRAYSIIRGEPYHK